MSDVEMESSSESQSSKAEPHFHSLEDFSSYLNALNSYLQETKVDNLELDLYEFSLAESRAILELLPGSEVKKLDLCSSNFLKPLTAFLPGSKIQKLNLTADISTFDLVNLVQILNHTQLVHLDVCFANKIYAKELFSSFRKSSIQVLKLQGFINFSDKEADVGTGLPSHSSITSFRLQASDFSRSFKLFHHLPFSSLTKLFLSCCKIGSVGVAIISENLKNSKLEKLNLCGNDIDDAAIDNLCTGLRGSKIVDLCLSNNKFVGRNNLGSCLKETVISHLDIGVNDIRYDRMFNFPEFVRGTTVTTLGIDECGLNDDVGSKLMKSLAFSSVTLLEASYNDFAGSTISEFVKNLKDMNISEVDFSNNLLTYEMLSSLSGCLNDLRLNEIIVTPHGEESWIKDSYFTLWRRKGSPTDFTSTIDESVGNFLGNEPLMKFLASTAVNNFHLESARLNLVDSNSVSFLKCYFLVDLNLTFTELGDVDAKKLAEVLKDTDIVSLDLGNNKIGNEGAKALAQSLKESNLLTLNLDCNLIGNEGLETLVECVEGTFITYLSVNKNPGKRTLIVETALLKNRLSAHKFVKCFKQIAPDSIDKGFQFDRNLDCNMDNFIEEVLMFYKTYCDHRCAAWVLEGGSVMAGDNLLVGDQSPFSKNEIKSLLTKFPSQFAQFVGRNIETDVSQHVRLLRRAEDLDLTCVVENLLLNRPLFVIDKTDILHPFVYKLLYKYNIPICNLDVEPDGYKRIVDYFKNHLDSEEASDVIKLLQG